MPWWVTATDPLSVSPVVAGGTFQVQKARRAANPFATGASRFPPTRAVQVIVPLVTAESVSLRVTCSPTVKLLPERGIAGDVTTGSVDSLTAALGGVSGPGGGGGGAVAPDNWSL